MFILCFLFFVIYFDISNIKDYLSEFTRIKHPPHISLYLSYIIIYLIINMKGKGRTLDQAILRNTANKKSQTFATKRLMKDL